MRQILLVLLLLSACQAAQAQVQWPSPEIESVFQRGRDALSKGSIRPAVALFRQVVDAAPGVPEGRRELANALQLGGAPAEALEVLEPLFKTKTADPQAYRIGALAWKATGRPDNSEDLLRKGLKQHPESGLLYHELGVVEDGKIHLDQALKAWLDGIEKDPGYYVNYYDAAHSYVFSTKLVWCLLYAETFLLYESQTPRSAEARKMLLAAYRRFFFPTAADEKASSSKTRNNEPGNFEEAVVYTLRRAAPVVSDGITSESLTMLRTRFIIDWNETFAKKYPYALFQYQDELLREGLFDGYCQQLLGRAENEVGYRAWTSFHPEAVPAYEAWIAAHPFRPVPGQFYNDKKTKGISLGEAGR